MTMKSFITLGQQIIGNFFNKKKLIWPSDKTKFPQANRHAVKDILYIHDVCTQTHIPYISLVCIKYINSCTNIYFCVCVWEREFICVCLFVWSCVCVCVSVCLLCLFVRFVFLFVRVCMCVCVCVCVCVWRVSNLTISKTEMRKGRGEGVAWRLSQLTYK